MKLEARNLVTLSNALNRSSYSLSLPEKRLLMYAISLLDKSHRDNQMLEIGAKEYSDFYHLNSDGAYRTVRNAADNLWTRTLVAEEIKYRWVITSYYKDGVVFLQFHPLLLPHLVELKNQFTQYFLHRAADFKLMYTWRLFELIMQFKRTGFFKISLDEFKETLDIPSSYSRDFGLIRSKIIEPAVKEIRQKDGLKLTWKPIKRGRSFVSLEFKFPVEPQHELFKPDVIDKTFIEKHARPGESYEQAGKRLKEEAKKQTE
ncbi:replication initiation protein [uncultured Paraglaciecola sp.]|uniref:replication initiation protein n=1 Tax=uncultured Paraglaciecola sp. TaxID=1765024 RepID=UPI00262B7FBC|nr:replication initiation protein [uncultured Paraglaciecola sp.]